MEALTFLKFWKTAATKFTTSTTTTTTAITDGDSSQSSTVYSDPFTEESDDDDDSFFELELTSSHNNSHSPPNCNPITDLKSTPKPQSPVSILRSASPKLHFFTFGKFRKASKPIESEYDAVSSTMSPKRTDMSLFTVKFKIEDGSIVPKFTRSNSSNLSGPTRKSNEGNGTSTRFSKEAVSKYINKIKPLYTKSAKKSNESESFISSPARSTASISSPMKENDEKRGSFLKGKGKYLGKCKSDLSVATGGSSPVISPVRSDHPCDGIESAILHCKLSLHSPKTKGKSALSRCGSDPSHDKTILM